MGSAELQGTDRVDIWIVPLDAGERAIRACRAFLSPEESFRASRFAAENLRTAFEVAHGALRVLLSRYLQSSPRELTFTPGPKGKPALNGNSRLRFNLSHSGGLAAYAFANDCDLGIDIEQVHAMPDLEAVAARFFCAAEAAQLRSIPAGRERQEAFFRCWTRKESYIKAVGDGLAIPLDGFQVTLLPDDPAGCVQIGGDAGAAEAWTLHHLDPAPGYIGALAYREAPRRLVLHPPLPAGEVLDWAP